mmetsp:Transcript_6480/g.27276  ORF Transcript_6480/g.27276 Transcript_6480/m.27276 type:complete len:285 (-) Transcript_6480:1109-1963(-)
MLLRLNHSLSRRSARIRGVCVAMLSWGWGVNTTPKDRHVWPQRDPSIPQKDHNDATLLATPDSPREQMKQSSRPPRRESRSDPRRLQGKSQPQFFFRVFHAVGGSGATHCQTMSRPSEPAEQKYWSPVASARTSPRCPCVTVALSVARSLNCVVGCRISTVPSCNPSKRSGAAAETPPPAVASAMTGAGSPGLSKARFPAASQALKHESRPAVTKKGCSSARTNSTTAVSASAWPRSRAVRTHSSRAAVRGGAPPALLSAAAVAAASSARLQTRTARSRPPETR